MRIFITPMIDAMAGTVSCAACARPCDIRCVVRVQIDNQDRDHHLCASCFDEVKDLDSAESFKLFIEAQASLLRQLAWELERNAGLIDADASIEIVEVDGVGLLAPPF